MAVLEPLVAVGLAAPVYGERLAPGLLATTGQVVGVVGLVVGVAVLARRTAARDATGVPLCRPGARAPAPRPAPDGPPELHRCHLPSRRVAGDAPHGGSQTDHGSLRCALSITRGIGDARGTAGGVGTAGVRAGSTRARESSAALLVALALGGVLAGVLGSARHLAGPAPPPWTPTSSTPWTASENSVFDEQAEVMPQMAITEAQAQQRLAEVAASRAQRDAEAAAAAEAARPDAVDAAWTAPG